MAERRMFAKTIIDSDAFLDMPLSTQSLYFHLSMRADDDGFINNPKKIQRMVGASEDDLKLLVAKNFIIPFESGIVVIKHWKIHNYIRSDRYKETVYAEEKASLNLKENGAYTFGIPNDTQLETACIPDGYQMDTQVRLGEVSLGEDSERDIKNTSSSSSPRDIQRVIDAWNAIGAKQIKKIVENTDRHTWLKTRIRDYGLDSILEAIENVKNSDFLMGRTRDGFNITFDWFIRPNNFPKVLDGNYTTVRKDEAHGSNQSPAGQAQRIGHYI